MAARFARAWITGGSSGIGLALARRLLADGTTVAILARQAERLERARALRRAIARTEGGTP